MTDLPPLHARLHEATPEAIADALRYLGTADAVAALLAAAEGVERDAWLGAFVQGAKWWEWHKTGATMWQSDQALAYEQAQVKRAAMRDSGEGRE